jgi:predicted DCC family thiol-disulfide oxidoreductase YuxK
LILKLDKKRKFRYISLQSETVDSILSTYFKKPYPDTFFYIRKGVLYCKSSAALKVGIDLGFPAMIIGIGYIFPVFLRNIVYDFIAANRYRWFGKTESCMIPGEDVSSLFIS